MRILELFAGIGGVAAAIAAEKDLHAQIVSAIDIDAVAKSVYQANFPWRYRIAEIASIAPEEFAAANANVWWMSPPCLPFSIRGQRKDLHDPRNQALRHLIDVIVSVRPPVTIIENVPGFENSETCKLLFNLLCTAEYRCQIVDICPTEFGWCNKRKRIYFVAWQQSRCGSDTIEIKLDAQTVELPTLNSMIDHRISRASHPSLYLEEGIAEKYRTALDRLTLDDVMQARKPTACFAASYGKTYLHAGSYFVTDEGLRRFSLDEVKRQLGFDESFSFPEAISTRTAWKLLGSSLSIPFVRRLLRAVDRAIRLD